MRVMRGMVNGAVSELSGGGAMREQAAAVTRDYISQPRLSEYRGPSVPRESLLSALAGAGKRPEWGGGGWGHLCPGSPPAGLGFFSPGGGNLVHWARGAVPPPGCSRTNLAAL